MLDPEIRQLYRRFAEMLDYPGDSPAAAARACQPHLTQVCAEAATHLETFATFLEREDVYSLQEIYTRTFDITPTTNLYVGFHLFGESYKRGAFLARLEEAFEQHDFHRGSEIADHLSVLLRFASVCDDAEFVLPLLDEAILPALGKIEEAFKNSPDGYALAVRSLKALLESQFGSLASRAESLNFPVSPDSAAPGRPGPNGWSQPPCGGTMMTQCLGAPGPESAFSTALDPRSASRDPRLYPGGMEHD